MKKIVTPKQMAAADRATIEAGTSSLDLIERAGRAVGRAAIELAGGAYGRRVVVVCGKGSNGGDGFVAARYVATRGAFPVVVLLGDPRSFSADALDSYSSLGAIRVIDYDRVGLARELGRASAIVDAVVGTGFRGTLEGHAADAVDAINRAAAPVLAVDIPSGVDGETGKVEGPAVRADLTVTMGAPKIGLVLHPGSDYAGEVRIADIGVSDESIETNFWLAEADDVRRVLPARPPVAHKSSVGTALVVAGSVGMSGAAALAASGALRAGAGLVTVAAPASVALELDLVVLEATTMPLAETGRGTIEPSAVAAVIERSSQVDAVAIGPGLSQDPETVEFVHKLVGDLNKPLVMDADAINAYAGDPESIARRAAPTLLTPHPGELGRLLGKTTAEITRDRLGAVREGASRTKAAVLLKGFRTIVASPQGDAVVIGAGGPSLATGGSGDVLTGIATALLASGMEAFEAGWAAAWIHGRCGDRLAEIVGERSTVASDILGVLPAVMKDLE